MFFDEEIFNEVRKVEKREEELWVSLEFMLKKGEEFVKFCEENILNKETEKYNRYGFSKEALIDILKYFGVKYHESQETKLQYDEIGTEYSVMPKIFGKDNEYEHKVCMTYVLSQAERTNLAIIIYYTLLWKYQNSINQNKIISTASTRGSNIFQVGLEIKAFITPMLCSKEGYIKNFYSYKEDKEFSAEDSSGEKILKLQTAGCIDIEMATFIDSLYSRILKKENPEFEIDWEMFVETKI